MKPNKRRQLGLGPIVMVEEAVHLLRMNAGGALATYYFGSLPFVLALLYFWGEMSSSPFAARQLPGASLGMALLFLWMKFWQALFLGQLRAKISAQPPVRWTARRCLRVLVIQTALQPSGVFLLPLALVPLALPFGTVYAFYQSVTALNDGEISGVRKMFRRACKQAVLWPSQNHGMLGILLAFGLCVFINLMSVCIALPHLLKMILGIESVYTQSMSSMLNTTFFAALFGLTYLCVDPLVKAVYLLRCFYGESLQSGEDLKAELKRFAAATAPTDARQRLRESKNNLMATIVVIALSLLFAGSSLFAADAKSSPAPASPGSTQTGDPGVSSTALDKAITQTIQQPKYTWRMPRKTVVAEDSNDGPITRFLRDCASWVKETVKSFFHWLGDWLDKLFRGRRTSAPSGFDWVRSMHALLVVLFAVVVGVLVFFIIRAWHRRRRVEAVTSEAILPTPDLADENVGADQLPEDGWISLGKELLGRGELRLAMRAFYFASLVHLATKNLISIARFKSNRDYERELQRRGHALPDVLSLFGENVTVFDRAWYGLHEINQDTVGQFLTNVERIKTAG